MRCCLPGFLPPVCVRVSPAPAPGGSPVRSCVVRRDCRRRCSPCRSSPVADGTTHLHRKPLRPQSRLPHRCPARTIRRQPRGPPNRSPARPRRESVRFSPGPSSGPLKPTRKPALRWLNWIESPPTRRASWLLCQSPLVSLQPTPPQPGPTTTLHCLRSMAKPRYRPAPARFGSHSRSRRRPVRRGRRGSIRFSFPSMENRPPSALSTCAPPSNRRLLAQLNRPLLPWLPVRTCNQNPKSTGSRRRTVCCHGSITGQNPATYSLTCNQDPANGRTQARTQPLAPDAHA